MNNPYVWLLVKAWLFLCLISAEKDISAQCTAAGPRSGTSFSDDNIIGSFTFSSPGNAGASDNSRATASAIISLLTGNTHYLEANGFGFSIPASASVCGITVEVEKSATNIGALAWITDHSIRLMKNGSIVGNDYNSSTAWTSSDAYSSYGGTSDLWGTTWSASDINSADFGVAFSSSITGIIGLLPTARIDHIRITVNYYDIPLSLAGLEFSASSLPDHSAKLEWSVINNDKGSVLSIERSKDQTNWSVIYNQPLTVTSSAQAYQYIDRNCPDTSAYYRIQVRSQDDRTNYSPIVHVYWLNDLINLYPNPGNNYIIIVGDNLQGKNIRCMDLSGHTWSLFPVVYGNRLYKIDISKLPKAFYILEAGPSKKIFIKN